MNKPPASGAHAHYRPLGTPGPTGVNDHGDPGHVRRQGPTPGPLGDNDHAVPLMQRWRLIVDPEHRNASERISEIIARVETGSDSASLLEKLQLCAEAGAVAASNSDAPARSPGPTERCVHAYFLARRLALHGALDVLRPGADLTPSAEGETTAPATEPRRFGKFFTTVERDRYAEASPSLSYHRLARSANRGFFRAEADPARFWFDKGRADGLRDRGADDSRLQTYLYADAGALAPR
jgi:hypothetical protein